MTFEALPASQVQTHLKIHNEPFDLISQLRNSQLRNSLFSSYISILDSLQIHLKSTKYTTHPSSVCTYYSLC